MKKKNIINKELEKYDDFLKKYNNDLNILVKEIEEQRKELIIEQNKITKEKNKIIKIQEIKDIDIRKKIIEDNSNYIKKLENEKQNYKQEYDTLIETLDKKTHVEINNEIKVLKKVLIEYKSSKKILDEYKNENKFLLEHKFNLMCDECNHNKKIHENINYMGKINELSEYIISNMNVEEKIKKYEKLLSINDTIIKIDEKIINLKKEIENNNEIVMMDVNNKKNIEENNKTISKIKQMEIKYNQKNIEYENMITNHKNIKLNIDERNKLEMELEKILNIKNKYEENSENIQKLKNNLIDKDKNLLNKKNFELEIKKLEKEKILLENDFNENEKKQNELDKKVSEKNDYERIHDLFIIDKILDKKINSIINNLESIINNILIDLTDFTLKFDLSVDGLEIYKVKDDEIIDARVLSGYEKFSANLAMRIAFCKLNEYTRSNFLIIDEGFTSSSQNNLPKMETLFDAIRKYFKWCITVSHLDQIKSNYDFTHTIKKIKCGKTYDSYINI